MRDNKEQAETEQKPKKKSLEYNLAIEWFRNFSKNADHMPNSPLRPLPACLSKRQLTSYYVQGRDGGEDSAEPKPVHSQDVEEEFSTSLHSLGINMVMVINKETFANH